MYEIGRQIKTQPIKGLQVRKPLKNDALEVLSITLEKGSEFPEHTSPRDAYLIVLEGAMDFFISGKRFSLEALEEFSFPKDVIHRVEALEDSRFLIIR
ncbi:cupin domain-containing protein [Robiginitalea sp.]|uniref:cupin domain-containing protein n=1 Tax=Robiginitalea sp. TaxID=1902411 RepID=UPI003C78585E